MSGSIQHRPDRPRPWRARYRGPDGREHSKSFNRKVDADRWLRGQAVNVDRGMWVDPTAGLVPVGEIAEKWLAGRVRLTASTRAGYASIIRSRIIPTLGKVPVSKLTRSAVVDWVADMTAEGRSPSRVRNSFNVLAAVLDEAVAQGMIGRNPARGVELPRAKVYEHRFLEAQEVDRLALAMPMLADRVLVLVLSYGGLRWGEAVALRVGRVDVLRRRLEVAESAPEIAGRIVFGETKTHRRRTVHLPAFVVDELGHHLEGKDRDELVWTAPKGGPLGYNSYRQRVWDPAVRDAGLDGLTPHALRHSCASLMHAAGAGVKAIQEQLGHRTPSITMGVYTHLFEGAYDPVMDRLDEQHRNLVRPKGGPSVVALDELRQQKGS